MENKVETQVKTWQLVGCYEIQEGDGDYSWGMYVEEGKRGKDPKPMSVFMGRAWIQEDTLIMTSWKVADYAPDELQTPEAVPEHLKSLPKWDKTKYFVKLADFGMSGLMVCKTGGEAPAEVADVIMPLLGFEKVGVGAAG